MGASVDPFASYSMDSARSIFLEEPRRAYVLELFPVTRRKVRVLRQWAGLCDMTPDFSPIMGLTPVEGFLRRRRLGVHMASRPPPSAARPWPS